MLNSVISDLWAHSTTRESTCIAIVTLDRYKTWQLIQESIWVGKILIIIYIIMAAGIGQRTCEIEVLITSIVTREYIYGIRGRNLPNNPKKVKMIAVFIIWIFKSIWILKWKSRNLLYFIQHLKSNNKRYYIKLYIVTS